MKDIVLKRIANITSAQALDEISDAYPDAEVLSFRRIREAGSNSDFFVAKLKSAVMADESDDVVLDSNDIVIEDQKHEDGEEEKMNKIIELLAEVLDELKSDSTAAEEGLEDMQLDMEEMPAKEPSAPEDDLFATLPDEVGPPVGSGVMSRIIVTRPANVSKRIARIELIREFSDQGYRITSIQEMNGKYIANLKKTADAARRQKNRDNAATVEWGERKDKYLAPGTKGPDWENYAYIGSPTQRKKYTLEKMKGLNNDEDWPKPKRPNSKNPELIQEYEDNLKKWEIGYARADSDLTVPLRMEQYLSSFTDILKNDKNLNADEVVSASNKEFYKIRDMMSNQIREDYYAKRSEELKSEADKDKELRRKDFSFDPKKLGPRGEVSPSGWRELIRRGDFSVENLVPPVEQQEAQLLSLINKKVEKGDSKSAYDILMDRKLAMYFPKAYAVKKYESEGRNIEESPWKEEVDKLTKYLENNQDQNKRAYTDALRAAAGLSDEEQAPYLQSAKWYGVQEISPGAIKLPSGIGARDDFPGSIDSQQKTYKPWPVPESVEQAGGTPRSEANDLKRFFTERKEVNRLKTKQQIPPTEQPIPPTEQPIPPTEQPTLTPRQQSELPDMKEHFEKTKEEEWYPTPEQLEEYEALVQKEITNLERENKRSETPLTEIELAAQRDALEASGYRIRPGEQG